MSFLIPYITLKSIYNFYPHVFKIPYHLFARILLLQQNTTPPRLTMYLPNFKPTKKFRKLALHWFQNLKWTPQWILMISNYVIILCWWAQNLYYGIALFMTCTCKSLLLLYYYVALHHTWLWFQTLNLEPYSLLVILVLCMCFLRGFLWGL